MGSESNGSSHAVFRWAVVEGNRLVGGGPFVLGQTFSSSSYSR